jgi:endonuclease-3
VTGHGILPEQFAEKLRRCAALAMDTFGGDLDSILELEMPEAKKALRAFPGIGEPGAEKIPLFCGAQPILALESNRLRVLLRLGFGEEKKSYASTYRVVQAAASRGLRKDCRWLTQAHLLLRCHGQTLCRRSRPACGEGPLAKACEYHRLEGGAVRLK